MMKIRLSESQYNRLLTEDKDFGSLPDTFTPAIIKIFKLLNRNEQQYRTLKDIKDLLTQTLGINEHESNILVHNYMNKLKEDVDFDSLIGQPIDFIGTYTIKTIMPTVMMARTYIPGFVEVTAKSKEEALEKVMNGEYNEMYLDENSIDYSNPDLDYDPASDGEIMEDMVIDHVEDIDWDDPEEIEDRIKLKK